MNNLDKTDGAMTNPKESKMKSLAFGMVSEISRLLVDKGLVQQPIDIVEALVFAMFIIADTYALTKPQRIWPEK